MSQFVYLIASHDNPNQIVRLVKTIKSGSPDALVVIHHDSSHCTLDPAAFEPLTNVVVLEDPVAVEWGEFSMVQMELHCIDWILAHAGDFDWLIFLSGQDYPIKPLAALEQFLEQTPYDGFVEYFLAKTPPGSKENPRSKFWRRCFYRYLKVSSTPNVKFPPLIHRIIELTNRNQPLLNLQFHKSGVYLGIRQFATPFSSEFKAYTGSQWHTLSKRCVQHIHEFVKANPAFVNYYQKTLIPDEHFFQTILVNNPQLKLLNDNKRFIRWEKSCPTILGTQDFDSLIASEAHFARKFDEQVDTQIFDRLDRYLARNQHTPVQSEPR